MLSKLSHHLTISRHGIYYLRFTRAGKERRKSLNTRDPSIARAAAYKFGATIHAMTSPYIISPDDPDAIFKMEANVDRVLRQRKLAEDRIREQVSKERDEVQRARVGTEGEFELKLKQIYLDIAAENSRAAQLQPQAGQSATIIPREPLTIHVSVAKWLAERESEIKYKSTEAYRTYTKRLTNEFGDRLVHTITQSELKTSLKTLRAMPRSNKTVGGYAHAWHLFWDWLIDSHHATENPVRIPKVTEAKIASLADDDDEDDDDVRSMWLLILHITPLADGIEKR